jgi:hypothetical protein
MPPWLTPLFYIVPAVSRKIEIVAFDALLGGVDEEIDTLLFSWNKG